MFGFHNDLDNVSKRQKIQNEIDELLTNQATTVHDIFAIQSQEKQDEIINQLSVANKKAVKFFTNEERINELIDLIIKMPPENCSHERGHKFPFLANQVFSDGGDGVAEIIGRFFYSYRVVEKQPPSFNIYNQKEEEQQEEDQKIKEKLAELNESPQKLQESGNEDEQQEDQNLIFQNIRSIVDMLSGGNQPKNQDNDDEFEFQIDDNNNIEIQDEQYQQEERFNFQQIIEKFENPKNVKKSFELRYKNDDDDEIYITNDEEGEGDQNDCQEMFFMEPQFDDFTDQEQQKKSRKSSDSPAGGFEKIEFTAKDMLQLDSQNCLEEDTIPNPFKDTLANSDILPKTLKLDVEIQENYLDNKLENQKSLQSFTQILTKQNLYKTQSYIEKADNSDQVQTLHQENIQKRKKKKQNLSLLNFDEATQKSIAETVEKERQIMLDDNEKTEKVYSNSQKLPLVSIVDDHIKNGQEDQLQNNQIDEDDDFGEFNDRELPQQTQNEDAQNNQFKNFDDEEDNILRKTFNKINVEKLENNQDIQSPTNIFGMDKYNDQNSILVENQAEQTQEFKKEQDYRLIDRFFGFIESKVEPLNSTLCGYFCQVCLIMISREPVEMFKYMQARQFQIFDKMIQHIDNKSICDLMVKVLNEVIKYLTNNQENVVVMQEQKQSELQQSGQSGERNVKDSFKNEENLVIIKEIILKIMNEKMDECSDFMEKMGALDVLLELLKNQLCYQTLTTKKAFEIMTRFLVSDDEDCQRHVYILLKSLIQNYEKHERFQKRINIDNFEDDELFNSHSGSGSGFLNKSKKSKNSKKQNQDVMKEIQDSDLFQFIRVIVKQITCQEIEKKFELVNAAKKSGVYLKLGMHFLALIEFLEKASSIFSGFNNDINQTLVEIDVFNFIFVIVEYYSNSDILNRTVFKIVQNVIQTKGEEAQNLIRYMIEDTDLIQFLVQNGPKCQVKDQDIVKEELNAKPLQETKDLIQKSPEQSQHKNKFLSEEISCEKAKKQEIQFIQIPQLTSKGLQAHVKPICEIMSEHQVKINNQNNLSDIANSKGDLYNQSQSGEQSKSSEIIIETDEEQVNALKISKIIALNLNENQEWNQYVKIFLDPISKLQKGKLCEDLKDGHSGSDSENNIFDHDFMTSVEAINTNDKLVKNNTANVDFQLLDIEVAVVKNDQDQENKKSLSKEENFQLDEEQEDHKKFFQKMQKCFSNNVKKNRRSSDCVDNDERDMKMSAYQNHFSELHEDLRASLSDQPAKHFGKRRDRSTSNDNFNLPPLPDLERDINDFDDSENYKSNNKLNQQSVPQSTEEGFQIENQFGQDLEINDIDINLDSLQKDQYSVQASYHSSYQFIDSNKPESRKSLIDNEFFNNFEEFAFELRNEEEKYKSNNSEEINIQNSQYAVKSSNDDQFFQSMEEDQQIFQEKDEIGQIFEQINQFDKLYDIMDDDSPEIHQNDIEQEQDKNKKQTSPDFFKDLEIFQQNDNQINDIQYNDQDLNEIQQTESNIQIEEQINEDPFTNQKTLFQSQVFNYNNKIEVDKNENILSKSVCIENHKPFSLEIRPEFEDNQFWRIGQNQILDIDQLIQELQ